MLKITNNLVKVTLDQSRIIIRKMDDENPFINSIFVTTDLYTPNDHLIYDFSIMIDTDEEIVVLQGRERHYMRPNSKKIPFTNLWIIPELMIQFLPKEFDFYGFKRFGNLVLGDNKIYLSTQYTEFRRVYYNTPIEFIGFDEVFDNLSMTKEVSNESELKLKI